MFTLWTAGGTQPSNTVRIFPLGRSSVLTIAIEAMDRIHRLGQRRPVQAIKLVVEDSIESRIVQVCSNHCVCSANRRVDIP